MNIFAAYGFGSRRNTEKFPSCHVYDPDRSKRERKKGNRQENDFQVSFCTSRERKIVFEFLLAISSKDDRLSRKCKERTTKVEKLFIATGQKGQTT